MTKRRFLLFLELTAMMFGLRMASAAPEAHILRIDPRAGVTNGAPLLTTVVEIVQFNRLSSVLEPCANLRGYEATLDCWSAAMEKPGALWSPFPFPEGNARFFVKVSGEDELTKLDGKPVKWGDSQKDPSVGTAWLLALDCSSGMGARYNDARMVAQEFIATMQPNDLMDLMIFDDRDKQLVADSKWKVFAQRNDLVAVLNQHPTNSPSHGRDRPLFDQIKGMTRDAFGDLGNSQGPQNVPLHQAMIVLSNGAGRGDPASASPSADVFHAYLNQGRFPEDNTSLPKTPLPVISIWFPASSGLTNDLYRTNDSQFMQALANPEIGGFFDIVRGGQGVQKAKTIIDLVRARFNAMWIAKWRLSCLNSTVEQSFNLVFVNTKPTIAPDGSFKDVPIGVDPSQWPLDVDMAKTKAEADANPLYPGGTFRVYGDFCWSGDKTRAEAYFVPAGTKPDPNANSTDPDLAKRAMQQLIAQNMRGGALEAGDAFVSLQVPDDDKLLEGTGQNTVAHVVIYDNKAHRASGHDERSILTLKAQTKPLNWLLVAGIVGGVLVIGLLLLVIFRGGGGGGGKKRGMIPPPAPVVAGGYPGVPPYGGVPPAPGGYNPPQGQGGYGGPPPQQGGGWGGAGGGGYGAAPAHDAVGASPGLPIQVQCPACRSMTMAMPGQSSICFSCGQPIPFQAMASGVVGTNQEGGGGFGAPTFPVGSNGGGPWVSPHAPGPQAAMIWGSSGQFTIRPGSEVRVGRDAAQCPVALTEPRISGVHSTLKFEGAQLWVRDETSNNGTYVAGARISPGMWVPVPVGSQLRFGPVEFSVRLET